MFLKHWHKYSERDRRNGNSAVSVLSAMKIVSVIVEIGPKSS